MDAKLRTVLNRHHGGFDLATDQEAARLFDCLPLEVQAAYAREAKELHIAANDEPRTGAGATSGPAKKTGHSKE